MPSGRWVPKPIPIDFAAICLSLLWRTLCMGTPLCGPTSILPLNEFRFLLTGFWSMCYWASPNYGWSCISKLNFLINWSFILCKGAPLAKPLSCMFGAMAGTRPWCERVLKFFGGFTGSLNRVTVLPSCAPSCAPIPRPPPGVGCPALYLLYFVSKFEVVSWCILKLPLELFDLVVFFRT